MRVCGGYGRETGTTGQGGAEIAPAEVTGAPQGARPSGYKRTILSG